MDQQQPDLKVKISLDQEAAVKGLRNFYAIARNEQEKSSRESARSSGVAAREQLRTDEARLKSAARVATEQQRLARATIQTESAATRERLRSDETRLKSATRLALEQQRLDKETQRTRTEMIRQEILLRQQADREARKSQSAQRGGFMNALLSSRYALPGTNGNVMPLVGQTLRGGPGALAALATVGVASKLSEGFADGVRQAGDLQHALNILESQSKATGAQMAEVAAKARELGADTKLPATSSVDAANAMLSLSKASMTVQDSMDAARGAIQLGAAAERDAAVAGKIMGDALVQFKLPGTEATRVANLYTSAIRETNAEIEDFSVALKYVGPIANDLKIPIEDVFTALTMLAEAGIRGETAGTGLRTMLSNLNPTTKEAKAVMHELVGSVYDGDGKFIGLKETIKKFAPELAKLTDQNRSYALEVLFGKEAMSQANVVLGAGADKYDEVADSINDANAAQEEAEARAKGFQGALDGLNSTMDTFKEKRLTPVLGLLEDWVRTGSRIIDILDETIDRLSKTGNIPITPGSVLDWLTRSPRALLDTLDEDNKRYQKENSATGKAATAQGDIALFTAAQDIQRNPDKYDQATKEKTLNDVKAAATRLGIPLTGINDPGGYEGILQHGLINSQKIVNDYRAGLRAEKSKQEFADEDAAFQETMDFWSGLVNQPDPEKNNRIGGIRTNGVRKPPRNRSADKSARQLADALRKAADRKASVTEDSYDALVKRYEKASPAERKRLAQVLGIASDFIGEDQLTAAKVDFQTNGGGKNAAAVEDLKSAKFKIDQDRKKRAEDLAKIEERLQKEEKEAAKRAAEATKKKADAAADAATDANKANIEIKDAREKFQQNIVASSGIGQVGSLLSGVPGAMAGTLNADAAKKAPIALLAAAKSGKQTDLAAAFKAFDLTRLGGDWGGSIRTELSAIEQMAAAPGSRLFSREAGSLVQRRLGELRKDAVTTGDAALVVQIDEAIKRWKDAMKPASEIFAGHIVDRMSEAGQALFSGAIDSLVKGGDVDLRSFGETLLGGIRDDIGEEIGDRFARSAKEKLSKFFTETEGGFGNLFKGAEQSAMRIALTGYGMIQAIHALSSGGGKSWLGGLLGLGLGIATGGVSNFATGLGFFNMGTLVANGNFLGAASSYLGMQGGGGGEWEYGGYKNYGPPAPSGKSRSQGGPAIVVHRVHNGDIHDRADADRLEQLEMDQLNGLLARI